MEKLQALKLTKKEMDTTKAREYINKNSSSIEWPGSGQFVLERGPNDITKYSEIEELIKQLKYYKVFSNAAEIGKKLATKIEDNADMLVQLEYLARGTDARDVRDGHIRLISQLSRCSTALWNAQNSIRFLHFTETTPLYNLGSVVGYLYNYHAVPYNSATVIIVDNESILPLCKFFAQLCRDVGLEIPLVYANSNDIEPLKTNHRLAELFWSEPADNMGCTGVIAERSDLDSAIDAFINSSVTAPWRIEQIYIQESIFEDFKSALAAKALQSTGDYTVGNKTFLVENLSSDRVGIPTHAYRTTKELLSLLKTPYLSIWAAVTAVSHEVALLSSAYTVWVNEYATFDGPDRSCLSVYNLSVSFRACTGKIKDTLKAWTKLRKSERLEVIVNALKANTDEDDAELLEDLAHWRSDDVIHVTENSICFGIQQPLGVVEISDVSTGEKQLARTITLLLNGSAVVDDINDCIHFDELMKVGAPIQISSIPFHEVSSLKDVVVVMSPLILERLKVVRTNYGTIFAN